MQSSISKSAFVLFLGRSLNSQCAKSRTVLLTRYISTSLPRRNQDVMEDSSAAKTGQEKWDLYVGLCLERRPVITKDKTPLEEKQAAFLAQYEVELSKKSDHEVRHENDAKLIEKIKKGEVDQANVTTAEDFEEASLQELQAFKPVSRITEADKKNDLKSLERSLQTHLLLAVHQELGKEYKWVVPHLKREDGETLREVAERAVQTFCPSINARILGNAPWGIYKYKYPMDARSQVVGAKVFFYKAQVLSGQMELPKTQEKAAAVDDYLWLTRGELPKYFVPAYFNALSEILIPEY